MGRQAKPMVPVRACLPVLARLLEMYGAEQNSITKMVVHACALVIRDGEVGHIRNLPAELQGELANAFPAARDFVRSFIPCPGSESSPEPVEFDEVWRILLEQTGGGAAMIEQPDLFGEAGTGGEIDFSLPVLSIRQPWAWFILHGGKDVENRCWQHGPKYRGRFLIHASSGCTKAEYEEAVDWVHERKLVDLDTLVSMPYVRRDFCPFRVATREAIERGGIVGEAELWKVTQGEPPRGWYTGEVGLWLRAVKPLPFFPCKGKLGFFKVGGGS